MDVGSVVDLYRDLSAIGRARNTCNHILEGTLRLPRKRIMGWRPCCSILVAFMMDENVCCGWCDKSSAVAAVDELADRFSLNREALG